MTNSMRALLVGAALTGFVAGTSPKVMAQDQSASPNPQTKSDDSSKEGKKASKSKKEKHACKGQNSCKGKGGCKTSDNGCKGKNSCKGKGGCATDGSKMPAEEKKG